MEDHKILPAEFEKKFSTNLKTGLTNEEADKRLVKDGPNKLT
jgi:magnesium-transporting ATPase (P-type)